MGAKYDNSTRFGGELAYTGRKRITIGVHFLCNLPGPVLRRKMMANTFKVTIHMVSSLDGIIAKKDNSVSWFETPDYYEKGITVQDTEEFLKTIDCYVMGSRTYEHALELSKSYGWAYGDKPTIVVTHRNLLIHRQNIKLYSGDLNRLVNERLKPNYKNVWLIGGATLAKDFIRLKLADEIRLSVMPVILGEGTLFFDHIGQEQALHLEDVTAYKSGIVELCYAIRK
jgi:dihydrofolate reductase